MMNQTTNTSNHGIEITLKISIKPLFWYTNQISDNKKNIQSFRIVLDGSWAGGNRIHFWMDN